MRLYPTLRNWLMALVAVLLGGVALSVPTAAEDLAGGQGIDTSLPLTDSAVTVTGRDQFADLKITVNQTEDLNFQAISVTWEGARPTTQGPGRFGSNYLQIFQCWGEPEGDFASNPGPPPEQCVQGATAGAPGVATTALPQGFASTRLISRRGWDNFDETLGVVDPISQNLWMPFRAVDGTEVPFQTNSKFNESLPGESFWLNPYFGIATTNEVVAASSNEDGSGAELMQVLTGVESSGLGCGQRVQPPGGGAPTTPQCWIVVVPRGSPIEENVGTPFAVDADQKGVSTSPLAPAAWRNRIAIPIAFNSVDPACAFADFDRRLSGNELALAAISSWQPLLCGEKALPPFSYGIVGDGLARQQLATASAGAAGLVVISRPLPPEASTPSSPVVYSPLTLSGVTVGFNVERVPRFSAPAEAQRLAGIRVAEINLTPRLVAKLLTQSYTKQVLIYGSPDYPWIGSNPNHPGVDPDFLRFNPEFSQLEIGGIRNFAGLSLPAGNSDAALQVWEWVLSDPEARAWLDGAPDEWGMVVNPVYATTAEANLSGAPFGDPLPAAFPKGDPYCYQGPLTGVGREIVPPPLCGTDWLPYSRGFADAAIAARQAFDGARIVENPFPLSANEVWRRDNPQTVGQRSFLSLTDTASAAQFGLQTARLSRAGDNGTDREFIAPDAKGLRLGAEAMVDRTVPGFLEPDGEPKIAAGAYPLTTLTYAAVKPLALDSDARADYASFLEYAAREGQQPGLDPGNLPRGYVPLTPELVGAAETAAETVRTLTAPDPTPTPPPTPAPAPAPAPTPPAPTSSNPATSVASTVPSAVEPTTARSTGRGGAPTVAAGSDDAEVPEGSVVSPPVVDDPEQVVQENIAGDDTPTVATPGQPVGRARYAVAGAGVAALVSVLGALEITKRPRRPGRSLPSGGEGS